MAKTMPERKGPSALGLDAELARRLLYTMLLIRRFEEKAAEAYTLGKVGGFLHLYIGQEAVAVAASSVLRADDYAISARTTATRWAPPPTAPLRRRRSGSSARPTGFRRRRSTAWTCSRCGLSWGGPWPGRARTRLRP